MKKFNKMWLTDIITDEKRRIPFQSNMIYASLAGVALFMSIINIFTRQIPLLISTGSFCVLCVLNLFLTKTGEKGAKIASNLFMVEIIALFSFFVITGGTDEFSIVWLLLLPTIGLLFFGVKKGTILSAVMLIIMLICFYVPFVKKFCVDYGPTWTVRFPAVFCCSYVVSLVLETIRAVTATELAATREKYHELCSHDALTGVFNRHGLQEVLHRIAGARRNDIGMLILDIDFFKAVNDTHGHLDGDRVLKQLAELVQSVLPENASLFRWGGEEFAVLYFNSAEAMENAEVILDAVRNHEFTISTGVIHITVSIGVAMGEDAESDYDRLLLRADKSLYEAKQTGRDRICVAK